MSNYKFIKTEKISFNFFIIRETYKYMAKIDKIPNAMARLYNYLEIDENTYDKAVQMGICSDGGKMKTCIKKLVSCGFSDTLFRKDSPTLIRTSDALLSEAYEYLFCKNDITLKEFQDDLEMYLGTIMNTDDTLLVVCTRKLINNIYSVSEPDDTLMDFMNLLDDADFSGHTLQKELLPEVIEAYQQYKANLSVPENDN